jgi:hypothetical protein
MDLGLGTEGYFKGRGMVLKLAVFNLKPSMVVCLVAMDLRFGGERLFFCPSKPEGICRWTFFGAGKY